MRTAKTDQTGRMPRLIWLFAECTLVLLILSYPGMFLMISLQTFIWIFLQVGVIVFQLQQLTQRTWKLQLCHVVRMHLLIHLLRPLTWKHQKNMAYKNYSCNNTGLYNCTNPLSNGLDVFKQRNTFSNHGICVLFEHGFRSKIFLRLAIPSVMLRNVTWLSGISLLLHGIRLLLKTKILSRNSFCSFILKASILIF